MWIKNIHDRSPFSPFIHALFWLLSGNKVKFPISEGNLNFLLCSENFRRNLCWRHCKYKEWVSFFSRLMGNESQCGTNKSHENRFAVHAICLFSTAIHFPLTEKKRHSFLNWTEGKNQKLRQLTKVSDWKDGGVSDMFLWRQTRNTRR